MHSEDSDIFQSNWRNGNAHLNSAEFLDASPVFHKSHSMWADTVPKSMNLDQAGSTLDRA
jgi:hypothetical protein